MNTGRSSPLAFAQGLGPGALHRLHLALVMCLSLLTLPFAAIGCSPVIAFQIFVPKLNEFERKYDGELPARLPSPNVRVLKIERGTASPGFSCADMGRITIRLSLPESSAYQLDELGFYFRASAGIYPEGFSQIGR